MSTIAMKMTASSSLCQNRLCPCGDKECYLDEEDYEEEELAAEYDRPAELKKLSAQPQSSASSKALPPPYIGQTFLSDDEALEYYTQFARINGFLVRRERSKGNPEHPLGVYKRELVCHRAGLPLPAKSEEPKRQRKKKPSRCKCEAQMVIKKNVTAGIARWLVVNFNNVHNHELLDRYDSQYSPGYRYISATDRIRILTLSKGGCDVSLIMKSLELEKGVKPGELSFTEKDVNNFLQASASSSPENEGSELLRTCKLMKERNPDFRYEFELDEVNKLQHVAWSYVGSVRAYNVFGDVVFFDATYHLYGYDRPVGICFGIDNNGHAIFFYCVVLLYEKPESHRWALQAFLRLMDGKSPQTIVTDFHLGLKDAILTELPHTKHAISKCHILSKLPCWFGSTLNQQYEKFKSEFCRIYDLDSTKEFEHQWDQMVTEFGLDSDRHMVLLFVHRSYWAVPYLRSWFFGGLLSSDHPMTVKSFFKGFVNTQTHLKDLVEQVTVAVDFQNQAGEEATTRQSQSNVPTKTCLPMEEHASSILTHYAFKMFQQEIMSSTQYAVFETADRYLVRHYLKSEGGNKVSCTASNQEVSCDCQGFEFSGIPCRHMLRVLSLRNSFLIPESYLLPRWRRDSSLFPKSSGYSYRCQALRSLASIIIQESSITKDRFDYIQWHLSRLLSHVREMSQNDESASDLEFATSSDATVDIVPARMTTRGRPRKTRTSNAVKEMQEFS